MREISALVLAVVYVLVKFFSSVYRCWTVETTYEHSYEDLVFPTRIDRRRRAHELTVKTFFLAFHITTKSWILVLLQLLCLPLVPILLLALPAIDHVFDFWGRVNWPDTWELFSYFLPKKTRERVFEPACEDLLKQYRKANRKYKNKAARFVLNLAWSFRFALLVADCWRSLVTDKTVDMLLSTIPDPVKQWWRPRF